MNRKEFLKKSFQTCLCCCGAALGFGANFPNHPKQQLASDKSGDGQKLSSDLAKRMRKGSESPDWEKADKAISWIKNMIDHIDELIDEETKIKLLNACGRSCYIRAVGIADENKPTQEQCDQFFKYLEGQDFKIERGEKSTIIYYGWQGKQNPWGLSLKEGYCLCPIVESDVPGLSPSFCYCSAGYVREIIERYTGKTVKRVEVLESLKMGGKDCRFKVEMVNA